MKWTDSKTARELMVAIQKRVQEEIDNLRPDYRYATVTNIDYVNNVCSVQYPEDTSSIFVAMFNQVPWRIGQQVRIAGRKGDRHVAEVMGPTADCAPGLVQAYSTMTPPPGWLNCDGSIFDPTIYTELNLAIGVTYGGTPDSPLLPNLAGQFLRGGTPGNAGGAASHTHVLSDNGAAQVDMSSTHVAMRKIAGAAWTQSINDANLTASGAVATSGGAGLTGATDSTSTVPPYNSINWIIKY